jgi:hypothetical protein
MGGIAAVPLFGWWPIKAYRPCPGFVSSGGRYRRYGQSMDDVIAGKGRKAPSNSKKRSVPRTMKSTTPHSFWFASLIYIRNRRQISMESKLIFPYPCNL